MTPIALTALILFSATPSHAITATSCRSAVAKLSEVDYRPFLRELPRSLTVPHTDVELRQLYFVAQAKWAKTFPEDRVFQLVRFIQSEISKKKAKELIKARRLSLVLRSTFYLFANDHTPPPAFDDFVRYFGKMNGKLADGKAKKAADYASRVMGHLVSGDFNANKYDPPLANIESFKTFMAELKTKILKAATTETMSIDDYHDLRKWVRDIKILFDLQHEMEPTPDTKATVRYLELLNTLLGDSKDELKDAEKDADEEVPATVDPDFEILIKELVRRIQI